jgi:lipoprotein-anchoring transpeptidase ErfK/SrfK
MRLRIDRRIWIGAKLLIVCGLAATFLQAAPVLLSDDRQAQQPAPEAQIHAAAVIAAPQPTPAVMTAPAPAAVQASTGGSPWAFPVLSVLGVERPLESGEYVWDEEGAPAGEVIVAIDISTRMLSVYRGGFEIGRSAIVYGHETKPTPTGEFKILEKKKDHVSNLYDAEMPYMLRLTMDGIAIHGAQVADDLATHGCVGVPDEFAAMLFEQAKIGGRVLIRNGTPPETV